MTEMAAATTGEARPAGDRADAGAPPIGAHRLVSNGRSSALIRPAGEIDWWCAPRFDSPPLLWSLLEAGGSAARWEGARMTNAAGPPAGPVARTALMIDGLGVECLDGILTDPASTLLVRLVRLLPSPRTTTARPGSIVHVVSLGGFDQARATWSAGHSPGATGAIAAGMDAGGDLSVMVMGGTSTVDAQGTVRTTVAVGSEWSGVAVGIAAAGGPAAPAPEIADLAARLERAEADATAKLRALRLPRVHPARAEDAMAVLRACTYQPTGAAIASPTTSLPEAPGADRQFDYRYCWLRDAALAVSVASLLGDRQAAADYLGFVRRMADDDATPPPLVSITGDRTPEEREVPGVAGWAGSQPIRVGNAAASQVQYDAIGIVLEAVSVHLQTGGSLDRETWAMIKGIADRAADEPPCPSNGIWEFRDEAWLVCADIGRWLTFDRAIWIARGWRPLTRRRHWKKARDAARTRVLGAIGDDGRLPQTYDAPYRADASTLLVPLMGMLDRNDPRAHRLVDTVLADLGAWPFLYRYEPDGSDGFDGTEGAFVPVSWWAVSALAGLGRVDEARQRLDAMCSALPLLLAEEVDPATGAGRGNVPLLWSHVEAARALYILDAAERRARWGAAGLWCWRIGRYLSMRWGRPYAQKG